MTVSVYRRALLLACLGLAVARPAEAQLVVSNAEWLLGGAVRTPSGEQSFTDQGLLGAETINRDIVFPGAARVFANVSSRADPSLADPYFFHFTSTIATGNVASSALIAGASFSASASFRWIGPEPQHIYVYAALSNDDTTNAQSAFALRERRSGSLDTSIVLKSIATTYFAGHQDLLANRIGQDVLLDTGSSLSCDDTLCVVDARPPGALSAAAAGEQAVLSPSLFSASGLGLPFPPQVQSFEFDAQPNVAYVANLKMVVSQPAEEGGRALLAAGVFAVSLAPISAAVPEPETYALVLAGLTLLRFRLARRKR